MNDELLSDGISLAGIAISPLIDSSSEQVCLVFLMLCWIDLYFLEYLLGVAADRISTRVESSSQCSRISDGLSRSTSGDIIDEYEFTIIISQTID